MEISPPGLMSFFTLSNCNKVLCNLCKVDTFVYEHFLQSRWRSEKRELEYMVVVCFVIKKKRKYTDLQLSDSNDLTSHTPSKSRAH